MNLEQINEHVQACDCGNPHHAITIERMVASEHVWVELAAFVHEKEWNRLLVVADMNTERVGFLPLREALMDIGVDVSLVSLQADEQGDVLAEERSVVQVLLQQDETVDALIALGAGTIHDVTRFCAAKTKVPFISVPTAPSVDGFTSKGAPLIVRGKKITYQLVSPIAVFVPSQVIRKAPDALIAAGVGDMLGKYTSLLDWRFGAFDGGEPFCPGAASLTEQALQSCVDALPAIYKRDADGLDQLMESLLLSGVAMLIFGHSHPASGGEHHLSHYWEMDFIANHRPAVLHGTKVAIATMELIDSYKTMMLEWSDTLGALRAWAEQMPTRQELEHIFHALQAPLRPDEIGVSSLLLASSKREAYRLRERHTLLKHMSLNRTESEIGERSL
ncbi:sn-glycerol-1-phosphate dehydrogenase [Exiguobacterium sp. NG55]|uniref:sn-glycerol-1-phosphate dehydrogenase n=1 Tax=Exiguobacterium sp. NG55 TaxID=375477 RepID=UPI0004DF2966|nr:sn-glycerol-1-phosphate dehydrogenase [Exiguobacterium sp. NG55]